MDQIHLTERGIGLATLWSSLELVLLQDLRRLVIRWLSNGSDSYREKFIKESVLEYMKRKETSVNLSKLLKETSESTWQCVIGDGLSSFKKTRGLIGLPNPEEELRLLEEKANETYGKYQDALQTTAGLEGQMGDLKDEIAAMSKQLSEEHGNISVYTDRQAKAIALKGETEIELAAQQKVLADEVKSHAGSIGAVKKDMEDIELAILKVEQDKGNRDHTIKVLQDEVAEQDEVINKLNKEKKHLSATQAKSSE